MPRKTPFHSRTEPLNQLQIWKHWSGYLVAPQYQYSLNAEYFAVRNAVSLLDTSPLFKYRISGADAKAFLERVLARNIRGCRVGRAQYTCWCDERGHVLQDGVVMQPTKGEYFLTAAEPTLRYFKKSAENFGLQNVVIEDVSEQYGILALQGPHAHDVLAQLTEAAASLKYFQVCQTRIEGCEITLSRTGFTGDLGYELWIPAQQAEKIWDALIAAGRDYNLTPIGTTVLKMARVEAGLLLIDADFHSSRFAWVDAQRETPNELGWGWMFRKLSSDPRQFVGRSAIELELEQESSRWTTVGLAVDWHDYERVYTEAGILPPRHDLYSEDTMSIYRRNGKEWDYAGYASSFFSSPLLRKPLALAKLPLDLAQPGAEVDLEVTVIRQPKNVLATVQSMPFFDPPRKTEPVTEGGRDGKR